MTKGLFLVAALASVVGCMPAYKTSISELPTRERAAWERCKPARSCAQKGTPDEVRSCIETRRADYADQSSWESRRSWLLESGCAEDLVAEL